MSICGTKIRLRRVESMGANRTIVLLGHICGPNDESFNPYKNLVFKRIIRRCGTRETFKTIKVMRLARLISFWSGCGTACERTDRRGSLDSSHMAVTRS